MDRVPVRLLEGPLMGQSMSALSSACIGMATHHHRTRRPSETRYRVSFETAAWSHGMAGYPFDSSTPLGRETGPTR